MRGPDADPEQRDLAFNVGVHTVDAAFFGLALGLASFGSVLPLFLQGYTRSALVLGSLGSLHLLGWHLPQLATARRVAGLRRYMPMVLAMTTLERLPFLALAWLAWTAGRGAAPGAVATTALVLGLVLLIGIGGGLTATPFQAMVGQVIPAGRRTLFYGLKAAAANLLIAGGAELAGRYLEAGATPERFAVCFLGAALATAVSWGFLALTREGGGAPEDAHAAPLPSSLRQASRGILTQDHRFRWYLVTRALAQLGHMASAFYTIYAIQRFDAGPLLVARLVAAFALSQTLANPLLGWAADRYGFHGPKRLGLAAAAVGALIAAAAPRPEWLYASMALAGIAVVAIFTFPLAMNVQFGDSASRPVYIGLSSSLTAPAIIGAPLLGGWLADGVGYRSSFLLAAAGSVAAALALERMRRQPALRRS